MAFPMSGQSKRAIRDFVFFVLGFVAGVVLWPYLTG